MKKVAVCAVALLAAAGLLVTTKTAAVARKGDGAVVKETNTVSVSVALKQGW